MTTKKKAGKKAPVKKSPGTKKRSAERSAAAGPGQTVPPAQAWEKGIGVLCAKDESQ